MTHTARGRLSEVALSFGEYPEETEHQRGRRRIIVGSLWFGIFGILFDAVSNSLEGLTLVAVGEFAQVTGAALGLLAFRRWPHRFTWIVTGVLAVFQTVTATETMLRGGLIPSGLTAMWGLVGVLVALIALSVRAAAVWFGVFLAVVAFSIWSPEVVEPRYPNADPTADVVFTLVAVALLTFAVLAYFVRQRDRFQEQSDRLLRNVLPEEIAERLKRDEAGIADHFDGATVLFADVVGFTPMSASLSPGELVALLEKVFSDLDEMVGHFDLEKIKTIGDEYMVAAGVPTPREDHAEAIADLALQIQNHTAKTTYNGHSIEFRIGINSGPVVAGVIGQRKFAYDLWGDTVNLASRLESHGTPGRIQVSSETRSILGEQFICEPRGPITLKGKGDVETWYLNGRAENR
jgi:guanylate cyclase